MLWALEQQYRLKSLAPRNAVLHALPPTSAPMPVLSKRGVSALCPYPPSSPDARALHQPSPLRPTLPYPAPPHLILRCRSRIMTWGEGSFTRPCEGSKAHENQRLPPCLQLAPRAISTEPSQGFPSWLALCYPTCRHDTSHSACRKAVSGLFRLLACE